MVFNSKKNFLFLKLSHWIQVVAILFGAGAIISVYDINTINGEISRGLVVLPNYLYWTLTVLFLVNISKTINYNSVAKYIFMGLLISLLFYFISPYIPKVPGFMNSFTPNGFAFLCICFTAPAATYLLYKKGLLYALLLLSVVLITLLLSGRRAGFVLVFISSILSISFKSFNRKYLSIGTIITLLFYLIMQLQFVEEIIQSASPRIHELIFDNEKINTEDRSLLTRKLMIEKSLIIFSQHPLTGIGLNNFTNFEVSFRGDFDGSEYVINKKAMNITSAHNSYALLLAEGGLLLFLPLLILILFNLVRFISGYDQRPHIVNSFYLSFLFMCVHLYFITSIVNIYAWFLIGLVTAFSTSNSFKKFKI